MFKKYSAIGAFHFIILFGCVVREPDFYLAGSSRGDLYDLSWIVMAKDSIVRLHTGVGIWDRA